MVKLKVEKVLTFLTILSQSGGILCSATQNFHFDDGKQTAEGIWRPVTPAFSPYLVNICMEKVISLKIKVILIHQTLTRFLEE